MSAEIFHSLPKTFSPSQWETLYALTSTVLPPLSAEETELLLKSADSGKDLNAVKEFARNGATVDNASFRKCLEEVIEVSMNPQTRKTFGLVLNLLRLVVFLICQIYCTCMLTPDTVRLFSVGHSFSLARSLHSPSDRGKS